MAEIAKEIINLPSKGYLYPPENPLSKGFVEMRYMTARDEDMLTNPNNRSNGEIGLIEILLKSLIITDGFEIDDLLEGDREQLLIAARILSYGSQYSFNVRSFLDDNSLVQQSVNLSTLKDVELDTDVLRKGVNVIDYTLPLSGTKIQFKFLTHKDLKELSQQAIANQNLYKYSFPITTSLKKQIVSVDGNTSLGVINSFVDKMLAGDSKEFRKFYNKLNPTVIKTYTYLDNDYTEEGVDFRLSFVDLFFRD